MTPVITIGSAGFDLVHVVLLLMAMGLGIYVWQMRQRGDVERERLMTERNAAQDELSRLRQREQTVEAARREAELKLAAAEARSAEDERKFAELAQGVLARANSMFLERAEETFKRHREGAQGELKELMKPIGENFETFRQKVEAIEKVRVEDKSLLSEQVRAIAESLHRNTAETGKLVNALTAPKGGGRWGEMTLRNVMEQAGLSAHCDFSEQVHDDTEEGRQRPDAIIRLPGDRQIVIDSKVSLASYMAATNTDDPAERQAHLKQHAASVQRHVTTLASKDYQSNLGNRFDYIAMFIPGENFFAAALEQSPDLIEKAMNRSVIVTTPTTLIALAKTVAHLWRQHEMNENAQAAAELGAELYTRIGVLLGHTEKLGKSLNSSVDHYNSLLGSIDKRVMPTLRKFEDMQIAPPGKAPPETKLIEARANTPDTGQLPLEPAPKLPAE
ncbi:DNA recombination protein RmuC [Hyphomonas sp. WL0036]|uniref:DNA recombination protein RmuC n=1 Tax=Hyphomonas sediminis TaxID=2866160 RepID=UPI001C81716B|nr:DNA recombination protein RmuC [Hyphomonas sediminis]MBY9065512.1 DNA recombination protein RmuC [Hyphomonas sediminis]